MCCQSSLADQLEFDHLLIFDIKFDWIIVDVISIEAVHRKLLFFNLVTHGCLQEEDRLFFEIPDETDFDLR